MIAISRRALITCATLAAPALSSVRVRADDADRGRLRGIADLEQRHGGRLGVAILDTARATPVAHRGDERFPLCSTHKALAAGFVLARVDRGAESLARKIVYAQTDLVTYSPITEQHVGAGLTMAELCEAALTVSDNTAANLLLDSFGGPPGLTAYLRALGDPVTRLDRHETALNEATPGDPRDTTTPLAMLDTIRKIVLGSALSTASRTQLITWLVANQTGEKRLRAGVPAGWRVGDKTGSGEHNATNDVAVIWPPGRAPLIVTAYYVESQASEDERNAILAEVGRIAAAI